MGSPTRRFVHQRRKGRGPQHPTVDRCTQDRCHVARRCGLFDKPPINRLPLKRRVAECPIVRMLGDQRIGTLPEVMPQAGPLRFIACRVTLECRFNQAQALTDAKARLDDGRTKAAVPRRSASPMALVECAHIATTHGLHQVRQAGLRGWGDQQPYFVVQQCVGMDDHIGIECRLPQASEVEVTINCSNEHRLTALTAMNDQVGLPGKDDTAKSGHENTLQEDSKPDSHSRRICRACGRLERWVEQAR